MTIDGKYQTAVNHIKHLEGVIRSMEARIQELEEENEVVETVSDEQVSWTSHFRTLFNQAMDENDKLKARLKAADELFKAVEHDLGSTGISRELCEAYQQYSNAGKEGGMKFYLVVENNVSFHPTVEHWAETSREELTPNGKWLTREDVEKAIRNHDYVRGDENFVSVADVLDELFGKEGGEDV